VSPDGHQVLWPQDLSANINSLMFFCAGKPGLSRALVEMLDFNGVAVRCRAAVQLKAGPRGELGWLVGKTQGEAMRDHCWGNGVLIGVDDFNFDIWGDADDMTKHSDLMGKRGSPGVVGCPHRVISKEDFMIFVSATRWGRLCCGEQWGSLGEHRVCSCACIARGALALNPHVFFARVCLECITRALLRNPCDNPVPPLL